MTTEWSCQFPGFHKCTQMHQWHESKDIRLKAQFKNLRSICFDRYWFHHQAVSTTKLAHANTKISSFLIGIQTYWISRYLSAFHNANFLAVIPFNCRTALRTRHRHQVRRHCFVAVCIQHASEKQRRGGTRVKSDFLAV